MRPEKSIVSSSINPEMVVTELFENYEQNPFHIDMYKYCTTDLAGHDKAEEILRTFLGKIADYCFVSDIGRNCFENGTLQMLLFHSEEYCDHGQEAFVKFIQEAESGWKIQDLQTMNPGVEDIIDPFIESIFGFDLTEENERLEQERIAELIKDDPGREELPGFSMN
jgi:hypothetical protein